MFPKILRINGSTKQDRLQVIDELNKALTASGGWTLDYKMFSNASINILFEISLRDVSKLLLELKMINVRITDQSISLLEEVSQSQAPLSEGEIYDITGTLQVTFIHNEPDIKNPVPPFNL